MAGLEAAVRRHEGGVVPGSAALPGENREILQDARSVFLNAIVRADRRIFVDTNILMYAGGSDPEWRAICGSALKRLLDGGLMPVTNAEVLQEILHRYVSQRRTADVRAILDAAVDLCTEVIPVTARHTARALELLLEHPRLAARDAIHVATMEERGVRTLLSVDQDFDGVPGVDRLDPRDFVRSASTT